MPVYKAHLYIRPYVTKPYKFLKKRRGKPPKLVRVRGRHYNRPTFKPYYHVLKHTKPSK